MGRKSKAYIAERGGARFRMTFTVLALFPEMFSALLVGGIIKRSVESQRISIETINIRDFATDRHRTVDDRPYGGLWQSL